MKTINLTQVLLLFLGMAVFNSCVQDDDFDTPDTSITEPQLDGNIVSIASVKGNVAQSGGLHLFEFENGPSDYMEGYVISSDEGSNFFEELVLQDKLENPTVGIKIMIDNSPLFTRYEVGRKVYVKLKDLSAVDDDGVLTLGIIPNANNIQKIPAFSETETLRRSSETGILVPMPLSISEFSDDKTNLWIRLDNVQFNRNLVINGNQTTFAAEIDDSFDAERRLESCNSNASTIFTTSTFADYKSLHLPSNSGSMNAILTKNFFGDAFNVTVNAPEDIFFDNDQRCDPNVLDCNGASGGGQDLYFENFEGFGSYTIEGWTNVNISGTNTNWLINGFGGNNYSRISAAFSGNQEADVWLVTPVIDLNVTTGEQLSFDIQASYDTGTNLTVLVTTNYTGDPTTTEWQPLDAIIPVGPSAAFGDFETIGPINISCLDGNINVGFFYEGSDPTATTRYHLDNIKVTGN
ncbi:hypothetical protein ESY86_08380 [Subsaximicrobium wynnwilliamsii]|uniref:DUF5689 domain-containing protein n=1 Tax=Subsaximicrobium wynnwilliamsii TaxID=291179 RepID=A0A5C6ZHZ7_9FLAO|nr:DUF5689 domain-containing protein [Subsaximicrobium wynnwilliamsii]TXD83720.1 hypothetical protein ESY87_08825 [Subsaximicrobium wynnwilliamsii]TXD89396.1 hypothetical protein ESY86_08380 [Subsaximicrobium wynnwilliamsii]TXE03557.1 hypothetical protein ESY88_07850 [Subsaximicrobium wynnwilliamsii]